MIQRLMPAQIKRRPPLSFPDMIRAPLRHDPSQATPVNSKPQAGNIQLNCTDCVLSAASDAHRLTRKTIQMPEVLIRNPGHLISSEPFIK